VVDLPVHHFPDLRRRLGGARQAQQVHRVADRRERVAQLVRERGEELVLAAVGLLALLQVGARLVLAPARAQRAAHRAGERGHAHRALEQRHVAERGERARDRRRVGAGTREQQHRQVGPGRLPCDHLREARVAVEQRFLGDQQRAAPRAHSRASLSTSAQATQANLFVLEHRAD
jgi:hypothetical protein